MRDLQGGSRGSEARAGAWLERPAVNASPLILLARAGLLELLQLASTRVVVPEAVAREIERRGPGDVTANALAKTRWLERVAPPAVPAVIQAWDLGAGESSVLALGLVLVAKQRGVVPGGTSDDRQAQERRSVSI